MESIYNINTDIEEGKLLLAAIAVISTSRNITFLEGVVDGTKMQPDDVLAELIKMRERMYNPPIKNCCN